MIIREHKPEDREEIEKCIFELQDEESGRMPHYWTPAEEATHPYYDYLIKRLAAERGKLFIAEENGHVVGFVAVLINKEDSPCVAPKEYAYIPDISVLKEFQGRGIGKELLRKAEKFAKESGMDFIHLDVTIGNSAIDFYKNQGWSEQGITMEKKLN